MLGMLPGPGALAKAAAGGRVDEDQVFLGDADNAGHVVGERGQALGSAMQVELAVFPVGHGAARLHGMVRIPGRGEAAFVDEAVFGGGESGFEVADGEGGNRARGRRVFRRGVARAETGYLVRRPLRFGEPLLTEIIAADESVRAAFLQAVERIEYERQPLESHVDCGNRGFGCLFVDRGQRQDRFADQGRFVGQDLQTRGLGFTVGINLIGRQNAEHTFHRQRFGGVDIEYARMGDGAGEQAGVNHALAGIVFRIFDPSGDLADHVRRNEVFSDMHIGHDVYPISAARMTPSR